MKRRDTEIFNLSFLDVLSGALGAVLFLFIVVPKGGGEGPAAEPQLNLVFDTINGKFYGEIPDSLRLAEAGDTLLSIVFNYDIMPSMEDCPPPKECPETDDLERKVASLQRTVSRQRNRLNSSDSKSTAIASSEKKTVQSRPASQYRGDLPSVPCKFSVEITWPEIEDNVDLFVCKEGICVYGGKKRQSSVGYWDSGKSKTSLFGGDLRTTQEAVRQFDNIIEGSYNIYAQYKNAESPKPEITINGLIYTNPDDAEEQGKTFTRKLSFNENERTLIGTLDVKSDGTFTFKQS